MIQRMITFEDARRIAAATLSEHRDYVVEIEPQGREDDEDFMVFVRYDVEMLGGPIVLVTKADESVHLVPFISDPERWAAMLPTGGLTFEAHADAGRSRGMSTPRTLSATPILSRGSRLCFSRRARVSP